MNYFDWTPLVPTKKEEKKDLGIPEGGYFG